MDEVERRILAEQYADGELTIHELREAGYDRVIGLLSDLHALGRRAPIAEMVGPNIETRQAGMARLAHVLKS